MDIVEGDVGTTNTPALPAKRHGMENLRSWKKGQSGNPNGTPSVIREFHRLLRSNEPKIVEQLVKLITEEKDGYLRLAAIHEYFDRLYGKPKQTIANESEDGKPLVAIQILAGELKY